MYIQFLQTTPKELVDLIQQSLKTEVETLIREITNLQNDGKEFLSRAETADFFGVSTVTIHNWVNDGLITAYKMGNRTYFKRSELVEQLLNSKTVA